MAAELQLPVHLNEVGDRFLGPRNLGSKSLSLNHKLRLVYLQEVTYILPLTEFSFQDLVRR